MPQIGLHATGSIYDGMAIPNCQLEQMLN